MKVIYKGEGLFTSHRISFTPSIKEYQVSNEIGAYLLKTFPNLFEGTLEKIIEKAPEKIVEKVIENVDEKPKAVKSTIKAK